MCDRVPARGQRGGLHMSERNRIGLLLGVAASVALWGCGPVYYDAPPPRPYPPYYYDYYYYPYADVYFHIYTGWYYYRDRGRWVHARRLPSHIHLDGRQRFLLKIPEKEPWRRNEEHRRTYVPSTPRHDDRPAPDRRTLRPPAAEPQPQERRTQRPPASPPSDDGRLSPFRSRDGERKPFERPSPFRSREEEQRAPSSQPAPSTRREEERTGVLRAAPQRETPRASPPDRRREEERDRDERDRNTRQSEEYRRRQDSDRPSR